METEPPGYLPVGITHGASRAVNWIAQEVRVMPVKALQYLFQPMAIEQ